MKEELEFVTYCGLYCELCAERGRIPQRAAALQAAMTDEGWPSWGQAMPGFVGFWEFLEKLQVGGGCPGCRADGGYPQCKIRICARSRGVELCAECTDFPCAEIERLGGIYATLLADNRRLRAVGMEQWRREQDERVRRGFVYADVRYRAETPE
jgi:hypothetical protein